MKRLAAWCACLLASLFLITGPAHAQTASDYTQGVTVSGSTATIWFQPASSATTWVDVHYALNGGPQQNLRMTLSGTRDQQAVAGVAPGNVLSYSFTYDKGAPAYDSASYSFTVPSATTASGPVCFYADINYGGDSFCASASSSWIGTAWNDRVSSVKVAAGYQAVLFGDINYGGASVTLTANTPNLGVLSFNDVASSFKIAAATTTGGAWNKMTTFTMVNNTHGAYADAQVYWAIIGLDWNTGKFVQVDASGTLVPMSTADNGALSKNGQGYSNYFHTLSQARSVTIPPINSARLLLSVGSPMYIKVVADGAGNIGYAGANIENPSDPNIDVAFDFVEMAIVPTDGFYGNTTRVDQFGFPVTLRLQGLNGFDQTVGETETRAALLSAY